MSEAGESWFFRRVDGSNLDSRATRYFHDFLHALPAAIYTTDAAGRLTFYNEAAAVLWGHRPELGKSEFCGSWKLYRPDGTPLPHDECPMALALKERRFARGMEAVTERPDGTRILFAAYPTPVFDASGALTGAINMLVDINERNAAEQTLLKQAQGLEALNRIAKAISSNLDLERIVQTVTDAATDLSGAKFGAFFYNVIDNQGENYTLYTLSGAPRAAFEKFGLPRNTAVFEQTFRGLGIVRSDDIRADPRYGKNAPHYGMPKGHLPVVSYLAVPVISRSGEVHGGLFLAHDRPGIFSRESEDIVAGIAAHAAIAIDNARLLAAAQTEIEERRRAEKRQRLLLREMNHRVKNLFALSGSIVSLSARSAQTPADLASAVQVRLGALARAHDLTLPDLVNGEGVKPDKSTTLHALIQAILSPHTDSAPEGGERVTVSGPDMPVGSGAVTSLALLLNELATNAAKYGALSSLTGRVDIAWAAEGAELILTWQEQGGPLLQQEDQSEGFGSQLIQAAVSGQLAGRISREWRPDGLTARVNIPVDRMRA